jgi:ribosomal protein L11 methyltransferase
MVYVERRAAAVSLARQFGGRIRLVKAGEWMKSKPTPPLQIGRGFQIIHEKKPTRSSRILSQLHIPQGLAFGSGEHATTYMLLRALVRYRDWNDVAVLDLGTGSGILALTARLFGARKIVATDFDSNATRTARQNEALNFSTPLIRWQCSEVKRLRATARYDLVLANLFSGILCDAAPQIIRSVTAGGQLWLSGVLRSQQEEVIAAYDRQRMSLIRTVSRGKWLMLQWQKNR